jgi:hypothetical protein
VAVLREEGALVPGEVAGRLGIDRTGQVAQDLRELAEEGRVVRGRPRRAKGQTAGRPSIEYTAAGEGPERDAAAEPPASEPEPSAPEPEPEPSAPSRRALEQWRAEAERLGEFTRKELALAMAEPEELAREAITTMLTREWVSVVSAGRYRYLGLPEQGKAAEVDRARARTESRQLNGGGGAVPGTGQRGTLTIRNKDVAQLVRECESKGATASFAGGSGHIAIQWTDDDGESHRVLIAHTPRGTRGVMNDRARLRRAGLL